MPIGSARYVVFAYGNPKSPEPRCRDAGSYEDAAEAIASAGTVIRENLQALSVGYPKPAAGDLYAAFLDHGEVPAILGEPDVAFNPDAAVQWHIRKITREPNWSIAEYRLTALKRTPPNEFTKEQWAEWKRLPQEERAAVLKRTPEQQALAGQFDERIGQGLVNNLNRNVHDKLP